MSGKTTRKDPKMLPTYFCQGHSTTCPACLDPEMGGCEGHGVISYCDGTCSSAHELLEKDVLAGRVRVEASATVITLEASADGGWGARWTVSFEGWQAEPRALAYIAARPAVNFWESTLAPFDGEVFPELSAKLYQVCHHGMSASMCMDPNGEHHFGTREWEMAQGW